MNIRVVRLLGVLMVLLSLAFSSRGQSLPLNAEKIIYVDKAVSGGTGNGSSWANAVKELADALKWAHANKASGLWSETEPLKIYVAKGTYKPMYTPEDGKNFSADAQYARDRTFLMVENVQLYGGFDPAAGKTTLAARILPDKEGANPDGTILSGDFNGDDAIGSTPAQGAAPITKNTENAYHVVAAAETTAATVFLDGFTVAGGNANGSGYITVNGTLVYRNAGGGIYSYSFSSSVTLTNSSVNNNSSSGNGGGIYSLSDSSSSSVALTNSSVNNNSSSSGNGGGIYSSSSSFSSSVALTNSSVNNNSSSGNGGGIYSLSNSSSSSSSSVALTNSSVNNNSSKFGGGGGIYSFCHTSSSSSVALINSSVNNNSSSGNGGGIYSFSYSYSSSVALTNSSVNNNSSGGDGGGIYSYSFSSVALTNSSVNNNSSSGDGGGIYSLSYSLSYSSYSSVTLTNSSVNNNSSSGGDGGGIYSSSFSSSSVALTNSSVNNNSSSGNGGGIYSSSNSSSSVILLNSNLMSNEGNGTIFYQNGTNNKLNIWNSILHGNKDAAGMVYPGVEWLGGTTKPSGANLLFKNSLVQGSGGSTNWNAALGTDGGGNLDVDPKFVNAAQGDYRLAANSPLINKGDNTWYTGPGLDLQNDKDLAGESRLIAGTIDIGAYENQSASSELNLSPTNNILYVDKAVSGGTGNGSSWANAVKELADALKWAHANKASGLWSETEPLKIYVAKGTYKPLYTPENGKDFSADAQYARDRTFLMVENVQLYGGFDPAAGKTTLAARILPDKEGANPNGTILSGDFNGDDTLNGSGATLRISNSSENAYHVITAVNGEKDIKLLIDGFEIKGGNADDDGLFFIKSSGGFTEVSRNGGGGIFMSTYGTIKLTLKNSRVSGNNTSTMGAGIYSTSNAPFFNSAAPRSEIILDNAHVVTNYSTNNGGGIYAYSYSNTMNSNSSSSIVKLENSSVSGNRSGSFGGGIFSYSNTNSASGESLSEVTLGNSMVYENWSSNNGGGIMSNAAGNKTVTNLTVNSSRINKNTSEANGGGVYSKSDAGSAEFTANNSEIAQNSAKSAGAAIFSETAPLSSHANTISLNSSTMAANKGASYVSFAQLSKSSEFNTSNSLILGNTTADNSNSTLVRSSTKNIQYSLVQGENGTATGNIDPTGLTVDDIFADFANSIYSLKLGAVAIGTGSNDLYTGPAIATDKDLAGNPRLFGLTIDMGAYENQVNNIPTDIVLSNNSVSENVAINTTVGTLSTTDADQGDTFTYSFVAGTGSTDNASFSILGNTLIINASPDYETKSSYSVRIRSTDSHGATFEKVFVISVLDLNSPPVLAPIGNKTVNEGTLLTFTANATDDGEPNGNLTYSLVDAPSGAEIDAVSGVFTWSPTEAQGPNSYTFDVVVSDGELTNLERITVTVMEVNAVPVATTDSYTTNEDTPLIINAPGLLANDTDTDLPAQTLIAVQTSGPLNGSLTLNEDGSFTYTPNANFYGTDRFGYHVSDCVSSSNIAIVWITVQPVNDVPVISGVPATSVNQDVAYSFTPTVTDIDAGDVLTFTVANKPTWASFDAATGALTGTPRNADVGVTTGIVITVSDGSASVSLPAFDLEVTTKLFAGVSLTDASFSYDAVVKSLTVAGTLPAGCSLVYDNNSRTAVGSQTVKAHLTATGYTPMTLSAVLTITPAELLVQANTLSKVYGAADPVLTYVVTGFKGSDTEASVVTGGLTRALGEDVGRYAIGQGSLDAGTNYTIDFKAADLTITKATITGVTFADASFTYDGSTKSLAVIGTLPEGTSVTYTGNTMVNAGSYTVTATIAGGNYVPLVLTARMAIAKAKQTIHFNAPATLTRDAGTVTLDVEASSGLPLTLSVDDPLIATLYGTDLQVLRLGTVQVTATQAGNENYEAAASVTVSVRIAADASAKVPILVHQAVSPNGDGVNEFLMIEGIGDFPENKVTVFDKNGVVQAEIIGYNNRDRVFTGQSSRDGTYYYYLDLKVNGSWKREKGFFVIKK